MLEVRIIMPIQLSPMALKSGYTVSTAIRFTTLPDATPPSFTVPPSSNYTGTPSQPPTTITAIFNPMMGHISTAYAARVSRDLSLCSRFDFNVYSYESEWTMGAEWWIRRTLGVSNPIQRFTGRPNGFSYDHETPAVLYLNDEVQGVVKARISTNTVCDVYYTVWILPPNTRMCRTCH